MKFPRNLLKRLYGNLVLSSSFVVALLVGA